MKLITQDLDRLERAITPKLALPEHTHCEFIGVKADELKELIACYRHFHYPETFKPRRPA